jgi:hypothetical protein
MQWHIKGSSPPKKFKVISSAGKIMATVFWDCHGILMIDYPNKGSTVVNRRILCKLNASLQRFYVLQ